MTHYSGSSLAVAFGGTSYLNASDISAHARSVDISETAPAPDTIDVTHKGDTAHQLIEGLAGGVETNVTLTALIDDTFTILDTLALNTQASLYVFPRGRTHNYPMITVYARLHERTSRVPYDGAVEISTTWNSKLAAVHTTYTSA